MKITFIFDYSDGKIYNFSHDESYNTEEMEEILIEKYNFRLDEIEWMTVSKLEIESLN